MQKMKEYMAGEKAVKGKTKNVEEWIKERKRKEKKGAIKLLLFIHMKLPR